MTHWEFWALYLPLRSTAWDAQHQKKAKYPARLSLRVGRRSCLCGFSICRSQTAFSIQGKRTRLQPAAMLTDKQGKETLKGAGWGKGQNRWAQRAPTGTNLHSTNLFFKALTLQSSTSMRIKSILTAVLRGKVSLVLKCCSLTVRAQIKATVFYSNSSPSCQKRYFAQISTSVCH